MRPRPSGEWVKLRALLVALVSGLPLVAAACGAGEESELGAGAELVPAEAAVFVALNTDFGSEQWETADDLLEKFPRGRELLEQALAGVEGDADFERDVAPALGPETDLVFLDLREGTEREAVVLTKPRDREKYLDLLEDDVGRAEIGGGWVASSEDTQALEAFLDAREGAKLADSGAYAEAMGDLEEDALARVYVSGEKAEAAAEGTQARVAGLCSLGGDVVSAGAALRAGDDGLHVEASSNEAGGEKLEEYEAELASELPDGAVAFLSFNDLARQFEAARAELDAREPHLERELDRAEGFLGVSLEDDVLPLLAGEGALAVYAETLPFATLLLEVEDEQEALETLDRVAERVARERGAQGPRDVELAGVEAREVAVSPLVSLLYAAFDGKVVVTTARSGIRGVRDGGTKLADDEDFGKAKEAARMPDETTGFVYADLDVAVRLAEDLAALRGEEAPPDVREGVEPLRTLLLYGSNDDACFTGFLGIE